jgi:hypothetical protein
MVEEGVVWAETNEEKTIDVSISDTSKTISKLDLARIVFLRFF